MLSRSPRQRRSRLLVSLFVCLVLFLLCSASSTNLLPTPSIARSDPVTTAWMRVQEHGSYHFSTDMRQWTAPAATLANVGRTSREERVYLEGQSDLRGQTMDLKLWSQGGSLLQAESGVEVRVAGGKTWVRQGAGAWEEASDFTGSLAPQGDFMAYLAAIRDVSDGVAERRAGIAFTRYQFTIDGPTFAAYVRDQLQRTYQQQGKLPPGVTLSASDHYAQMTGAGELWVGEDGLPLRQILDLHFPPQEDERVSARITVNFSDFGEPATGLATVTGDKPVPAFVARHLANVGLFALLATLGALLIFYRRARLLQRAVAIAMCLLIVAQPLLSNVPMLRFLDRQSAEAAAAQRSQQESDMLETVRALAAERTFDPQADPLAREEQVAAPKGYPRWQVAADRQRTANRQQPAASSDTDTDNDGLTDFQESILATNPNVADTDGDGLNDGIEVNGFVLDGVTWRTDPLEIDSNGDRISDGQEWQTDLDGDGLPDDTDGDGVPDLFDADNDNDGVPDGEDIAPLTAVEGQDGVSAFTAAKPFSYTIDGLQPGVITLVDVQVRPTNPDHLWYAYNALDWPSDTAGQLQDWDAGAAATDDLKLLPMLEIRISSTANTNLPTQAQLTPFNVFITEMTGDGTPDTPVIGKLLYVPLNVVTDRETDARVAFSAHIPYLPGATWGVAHEARMVWAAQMLLDGCERSQAGSCSEFTLHNRPAIVQTYDEDWILTGFSVREDHGVDMAVVYEDPVVDADLHDDRVLWPLSSALERTFLGGRDADGNAQRDLTVAEIARRFDRDTNSAVSLDERWSLSNTLQVERQHHANLDLAVATTAMTTTKEALGRIFSPYWSVSAPITPTLMYVREETYRGLNMDELGNGLGYAGFNGGHMTFHMAPAGQPAVEKDVLAWVQWTPYCATAGTGGAAAWRDCPLDRYWDELAQRYAALSVEQGDSEAMAAGRLTLGQIYYLVMANGAGQVVQTGTTLLFDPEVVWSDDQARTNLSVISSGRAILTSVARYVILIWFVDPVAILASLGITVNDAVRSSANKIIFNPQVSKAVSRYHQSSSTVGKLAVVGKVALVVAAIAVGLLAKAIWPGNIAARIVSNVVALGISLYMSVIQPLVLALKWANLLVRQGVALTLGSAYLRVLRGNAALGGSAKMAGAIGAVVGIVIAWGFFIDGWVKSGASAGSPAINQAFFQTLAVTLYLIALAVLSATVIGGILVALLTLIDVIISFVCIGTGVDEEDCFSISALIIQGIANTFYAYEIMIDTARDDLAVTGVPDIQLAQPTRGFVAGNDVSLSLPITTTAVHKGPSSFLANSYLWLFSEESLRDTTFRYTLSRAEASPVQVHTGQMRNEWQDVKQYSTWTFNKALYGGYAVSHQQIQNIPLTTGINQPVDFYLNTGYGLPALECWTLWLILAPIPVCYRRDEIGTADSHVTDVKLDVLPATVDGFMALDDASGGGTRLAWDALFPALPDADNDGLPAAADPNDRAWDSDGDGLTDRFELSRRQDGVRFDPNNWDTDGDGLSDAQEAWLGTDPASPDTDRDGLRDGDEVYHQVYAFTNGRAQPTAQWTGGWDVTIGDLTVRATSDPLSPDSDGDGLSDRLERDLALSPNPAARVDGDGRPYHPLSPNGNPLAVQVRSDAPKGYVRPGQPLSYTTTLIGNGAEFSAGSFTVASSGDNVVQPFDGSPRYLLFAGQPQTSTTISLAVSGDAGGETALTSSGFARLAPGIGGWQWASSGQGAISVPDSQKNLPAVVADPLQPDRYHLAFHTRRTNGTEDQNALHRYTIADSVDHAISFVPGQYNVTDEVPAIACLAGGDCLRMWNRQQGEQRFGIGNIINSNSFGSGFQTVHTNPPAQHYDYAPVIASNGAAFLVAWERLGYVVAAPSGDGNNIVHVFSTLVTQRVDGLGNRIGDAVAWTPDAEIAVFESADSSLPATEMDTFRRNSGLDMALIAVEGGYRLLWKRRGTQELWGRDGADDGNPAGDAVLLAGNLTPHAFRPAIAYDPVHKRSLRLDYYDLGDALGMSAFLMNGLELGMQLNTFVPISASARVAWDPASGGWLIAAPSFGDGLEVLALDAGGEPLVAGAAGQNLTFARAVDEAPAPSLACPSPVWPDHLVLDLPFEELPGATMLRDGSGKGYDVDCAANECPPVATTVGAPSPIYSTYALTFDGVNDTLRLPRMVSADLSLALWFKTTQVAGQEDGWYHGMGLVDGEVAEVRNDFGLSIGNGRLMFGIGNPDSTFHGDYVADGEWHFVVATRHRLSGNVALYLDGTRVDVGSASSSFLDAPAEISIGSLQTGINFFAGSIDNVQIYNVALSESQALALYQRGRLSNLCVVAAPAGDAVAYTSFGVQPLETGGALTPNASDVLTLTVDATPPTSRITSLLDGAYVKAGGDAPQTLIIAGDASDAASGVTGVAVSVNGGGFAAAEGAATWVYALALPGEGTYRVRTRATDLVGNVETPDGGITLIADATPPQVTVDPPSQPFRPRRNAAGQWTIRLTGQVADPAIGAGSGSGVDADSVDVLITRRAETAAANRWQRATVTGATWTVDYTLPKGIAKATGAYEIHLRAADRVGNRIEPAVIAVASAGADSPTVELELDSDGPDAALDAALSAQSLITQTIELSGVVSDPTGIAAVQAAFVPIDQIAVLSNTVVLLPLDEAAGAVWYADRTIQQNNAVCDGAPCPNAGEPGRMDRAVRFEHDATLQIADDPSLSFDADTGFSLQAWIKTASQSGAILDKREGASGFALRLADGIPGLELNGALVVSGGPLVSDDAWHHVVATVDRTSGQARLYVDDMVRAEAPFTGTVTSAAPISLGENIDGLLDQVMVVRRGLVAEEVSTLFRAADLPRHDAALAQPGTGILTSTWAITVPKFLEGFHQLDLYTADPLGNRRLVEGVWRGIIDTESPRVNLSVEPTGAFYSDPATNVTYYDIHYSLSAEDLHLSEPDFDTPCNGIGQAERSYLDTHWLRTLFPDLTTRHRLTLSCNRWETDHDPWVRVTACDRYGHCGEAINLPSGRPAPSDDGSPKALSVVPQDGGVVAATGGDEVSGAAVLFPVMVAASSAHPLREVVILVNGGPKQTLSFAQTDDVTRLVQSVPIDLPGEGSYRLSMRATDWSGKVQTTRTISFTVDTQPPALTLATDVLGVDDTYAVGSGVMRFRGAVSDSVGLATVQLRVGNGGFDDATIHEDGTWSTAQWIGSNIFTGTLPVTVRAIDKAGRVTTISRGVELDIPVPPGVTPEPVPPGVTPEPPPALPSLYLPFVRRSPGGNSEPAVEPGLYLPSVHR